MRSALAILIAVMPLAACSSKGITGEYCQKTSSGKTLCAKKENISCSKKEGIPRKGYTINCIVNGVMTDLAGTKYHWSSEQDSQSWDKGDVTCYYSVDYQFYAWEDKQRGLTSLTCEAANHFNIIKKLRGEPILSLISCGTDACRNEITQIGPVTGQDLRVVPIEVRTVTLSGASPTKRKRFTIADCNKQRVKLWSDTREGSQARWVDVYKRNDDKNDSIYSGYAYSQWSALCNYQKKG